MLRIGTLMLRHICIFTNHDRHYNVREAALEILPFLESFLLLHAAGKGPLARLDEVPKDWNFTAIVGDVTEALQNLSISLQRFLSQCSELSREVQNFLETTPSSAWAFIQPRTDDKVLSQSMVRQIPMSGAVAYLLDPRVGRATVRDLVGGPGTAASRAVRGVVRICAG